MMLKNTHATWHPVDASADVEIPPGEVVDVGAKTFSDWSPITKGLKLGWIVEVTGKDEAPRGRSRRASFEAVA